MAVGRNSKLYIADWELPGASGTDGALTADGSGNLTIFDTASGYANWQAV